MSVSWNNTLTTVFNDLLTIAAAYPGVGFAVTNLARTSSVATLTTSTAHGFVAGTKIIVRGTKTAQLDGEFTVLSTPTAQTFTYALAGVDVTPAGCIAGVSSRIGAGYRRFDEDENWEETVQALTPSVTGWFDLEMGTVTMSADDTDSYPAKMKAALYVYVPKDNSDNLSAAWDFAINFFRALLVSANYTGVFPNKATVVLKEIENIDSGGIVMFDCGCFGTGGIELPNI